MGIAGAGRGHLGLHHTRYRGTGTRPSGAGGLHQHPGAPSAQGGVDPSDRDNRLALRLLLAGSRLKKAMASAVKIEEESVETKKSPVYRLGFLLVA